MVLTFGLDESCSAGSAFGIVGSFPSFTSGSSWAICLVKVINSYKRIHGLVINLVIKLSYHLSKDCSRFSGIAREHNRDKCLTISFLIWTVFKILLG